MLCISKCDLMRIMQNFLAILFTLVCVHYQEMMMVMLLLVPGEKKGTCRDNTKRVLFRCETKETGHKRSKEIERKKQIKKRRGERERATDLKLKAIQSKWSLKFCSFFFVLLHFCRNSEARSLRISFTFCLGTKMQSYGWRIIREMTKSQKRETTLTHTEHREM